MTEELISVMTRFYVGMKAFAGENGDDAMMLGEFDSAKAILFKGLMFGSGICMRHGSTESQNVCPCSLEAPQTPIRHMVQAHSACTAPKPAPPI